MSDELLIDIDDGVMTVTLNRPEKKNALTTAMNDRLQAVFAGVEVGGEVRAVILTGAGNDFCSGADVSLLSDPGGRSSLASMSHSHLTATALHELSVPTIASIRGVAAGAGLNLALGCDLTVAAEDARLSQIFARRGLSTDYGGAWLLPRLIGLHRAKELAFFGEMIDAAEAERIGLLNRVVPVEELDTTVGSWAKRLAAGPPIALAQTKSMLNRSTERGWNASLDAETVAQSLNFSTRDTAEAIRAFVERREPNFIGR